MKRALRKNTNLNRAQIEHFMLDLLRVREISDRERVQDSRNSGHYGSPLSLGRGQAQDWSGTTPEERIEAVWELTQLCLAWEQAKAGEPRLQRSVSRVQRPARRRPEQGRPDTEQAGRRQGSGSGGHRMAARERRG